MKAIFILAFFILINIQALAQKQGRALIDSLLTELPRQTTDSSKYELLVWLSFKYNFIEPDSGILFGKEALKIAYKLQSKHLVAYTLNVIAINYYQKSNYDSSLGYYFSALKINEEENNQENIAANLANIGNIYLELKDFNKSLEYYDKAMTIAEKTGNKSIISIQLGNMALYYCNVGKYKEAMTLYKRSLSILEKIGNKREIASKLTQMGDLYAELGNFNQSVECYTRSIKLSEQLGDKLAIAANCRSMGTLLIRVSGDSTTNFPTSLMPAGKNERLLKSVDYLKKAVSIYKDTDTHPPLMESYSQLALAYEQLRDFENALFYKNKQYELKDSLYSENSRKSLDSLESRGQMTLKDQRLKIAELRLQRQNLIAYFLIGSIIVLSAIILVIIYERKKSERLLLNVLPPEIAKKLKSKRTNIADRYDGASIIFIDIVDFTELSEEIEPEKIVEMLNDIFSTFDEIAKKHNLEKIKTIGDCYMAAAGIPEKMANHADAAAAMALEVKEKMKDYVTPEGIPVKFRIGLDSGPVIAGVIGETKFIYDLWGDAVNTASRMETYGVIDEIQVTENFISSLNNSYIFRDRGKVDIKGKGLMNTYLLVDHSKEKMTFQSGYN